MAILNEICLPKGKAVTSIEDLTDIENALVLSSVKYNTTLKADSESVYLAPQTISDAVAMVGCEIVDSCGLPTVLTAKEYNFRVSCDKCLYELTPNERKVFGMSTTKPQPTASMSDFYRRNFVGNLLNSTRKINWLGNKAYTGANLAIPALLPNYVKADGIWTQIAALPSVPRYSGIIAAKNALTTKATQTTWTSEEVLDVVDNMFSIQTQTMKLVVDSRKTVVLTNEMYDALIHKMTRDSFNLCCLGTLKSQVEGGVEVSVIMYGDKTLIKYDEFSAAIKDLALVGTAWNLPNRAILMLGLPIVNYIEDAGFEEEFHPVSGKYQASYGLDTAIVEPYPADFYVIAY